MPDTEAPHSEAKKYRDSGIKAYQFMIDHAQSGPFSWWEGVGYPEADGGIWASGGSGSGGGSCPHMWGQSTATKVLWDSLIVQKADSTLLIGRGMPAEWIESGKKPLSVIIRSTAEENRLLARFIK